jgi:hypothetical protein
MGGGRGRRDAGAPRRPVGVDEGKHGGAQRRGMPRQRRKRGKGGWGLVHGAGRRKKDDPTARCRVEEESVGGRWSARRAVGEGGGRSGTCRVKQGSGWHAWAGRGKGGSWAGPERNNVDSDLK